MSNIKSSASCELIWYLKKVEESTRDRMEFIRDKREKMAKLEFEHYLGYTDEIAERYLNQAKDIYKNIYEEILK